VRPPFVRASFCGFPDELVVDSFAGGGGASTGIEEGLGRPVDVAINHDPIAIAVHRANHPETRHYCQDIYEVSPREAAAGRRVGLAWFSPDCTTHSRAKGDTPLDNKKRGLAWVVVNWAREVRPRVIVVENVQEIQKWGPLGDDGRPIKALEGTTFREWLAALTGLGYEVEVRPLVAADYGAPTIRKRLFVIARCDGRVPVFPEPTHGAGRPSGWRSAAEVIDWGEPCPSIFERRKPLAEATLRRIAAGIRKYVVEDPDPFVIPLTHQGDLRTNSVREPLRTVTAAHRGELAMVAPYVVRHGHYSHESGAGIRPGCGAGTFRGQRLSMPLGTVCCTNDKHLVAPIIQKGFGGPNGHQTPGSHVARPLSTVTGRDHHGLASVFLTHFWGTSRSGSSVGSPMPTVTAGGGRGGGHAAEVRAFLIKYYRDGGQHQDVREPLHTVTTRARFGLGMVTVGGEDYQIVDIGMRMLKPTELFAAQGFPDWYEHEEVEGRRLTKTEQISLCGNAVPPPFSRALAEANAAA